jgi:hypothetical protein
MAWCPYNESTGLKVIREDISLEKKIAEDIHLI